MAYDDADFNIRREILSPNVLGIASTSMLKFLQFQATRLKKVHALVVTAGTDAGAGVDIYVGTDSVGAITAGTSTAGTVVHSNLIDALVPANGTIEIKGKASSATMRLSFSIEHQVTPDAAES